MLPLFVVKESYT